MSVTETFSYPFSSSITHKNHKEQLFLAHYNEVPKGNLACFFQGKLSEPYEVARCLISLSSVVKANFITPPRNFTDPIVSVGNEIIRFEGFSQCAGVYARVDVKESEQKEAFMASGTTNVDFNQEMITALAKVTRNSKLELRVGSKELELTSQENKVLEKKVPLPTKWIKGLSTVQDILAHSLPFDTLSRLEAIQLFRSIPKGEIKSDYYLIKRGKRYSFSPMKQDNSVFIGGLHRLSLLQTLLPLVSHITIFHHAKTSSWQFHIKNIIFTLSISAHSYRGFSGE